jgi:hypothetical protein
VKFSAPPGFDVDARQFVCCWERLDSAEAVAAVLRRPVQQVLDWAHYLRSRGLSLRRFNPIWLFTPN